jgi:regulator of protease activity HflC (stomatin/prohibitin superfamily)
MTTMKDRLSSTDRANAEQDLRATSDSIRADARRLDAIEAQKGELSPGDPEADHLSADALELAERIEHQAKAERQITRDIA